MNQKLLHQSPDSGPDPAATSMHRCAAIVSPPPTARGSNFGSTTYSYAFPSLLPPPRPPLHLFTNLYPRIESNSSVRTEGLEHLLRTPLFAFETSVAGTTEEVTTVPPPSKMFASLSAADCDCLAWKSRPTSDRPTPRRPFQYRLPFKTSPPASVVHSTVFQPSILVPCKICLPRVNRECAETRRKYLFEREFRV